MDFLSPKFRSSYRIALTIGIVAAVYWVVWWMITGLIPKESIFGMWNVTYLMTVPLLMLYAASLTWQLQGINYSERDSALWAFLITVFMPMALLASLAMGHIMCGMIIAIVIINTPVVSATLERLVTAFSDKDSRLHHWLAGK